MKTLVKLWAPRPIWNPKLLWKSFRKDGRASASLDLAELEAINRCEKEVPEYFNFANDVLDKWSQIEKEGNRPPNPALWWINGKGSEVRWSYEELAALSRKAANVLMDPCGLQRGDRVILILPRVPEWWLLNAACIRTGIIFIPGTPLLTAKDILFRLQASKAKGIITNENLAPVVDSVSSSCPFLRTKLLVSEGKRGGWLNFKELLRAAPSSHDCVKTKSDEPMTIYFTSGTTGSPKMAEHTHSSFGIGCALPARYWLDLKPSDIMWNMSDTVRSQRDSEYSGQVPRNYHVQCSDRLSDAGPTGSYGYRFKSLKHCSTGGESLNPEVLVQWKKQTGLDLYEGYGQTEVGVISLMEKGKEIKPGSMGKPVASYDVQIIDANSANILASHTGREGEIKAIRIQIQAGPNFITFFTAHVDNPEKTASTFRGNFYLTGDRGWMDEDGYLWFVARADDVIMSSGYRIGPSEVENALIEHPAVVESAVVSSPDAIRGEVVKAYVVLSPSFASHDKEELTLELQDHVKKTTAPYKYPRKVEFVHQLPKTVSGKIRRNELRKKEWEQIKHGTHIW
uniref:Acyl-coenzyme A synthetase acsm4, mitochondrial n=1 Tax=Sphaerodactylus townsendi TaxID=933632 RepID=A0ACB8FKW2_9SAUR